MKPEEIKKEDLEEILNRLDSLEKRISLIESGKEHNESALKAQRIMSEEEESDNVGIKLSLSTPFESNLGEYGLAWLGNIVLFFAIAFLWQYFSNAGKPVLALVVGLASVVGVFLISRYIRKSFTFLSYMFNLFGYIILFYILLRLHFFTKNPLLENKTFATILLLFVPGIQMFFAVRTKSQVLAGLALGAMMFTAFICDQMILFFLVTITTTGIALYLFRRYDWWKAMIFTLLTSYFVCLIWLLKNPVSLVKNPDDPTYYYAFICFSIITALYSLVVFIKQNKAYPDNLILTTILLAGSAYSVLLLAMVFIHFPTAYVPFFLAISIYCIAYSVILKFYSPWKYSPALYALFGFVAISITIYGIYQFPNAFLLLICQSFLVLTLALWYRSQIITLMNTFLFVTLTIMYYKISGTIQTVNFAIPVIAFVSARIINWQKERLNIKTEFIRNLYLFTLFFSLLVATYKGLPEKYITVSWLCISALYFLLSIILKNNKYRWLALANLLVSAFYLFLVDLAKIDLIFRILATLIFAVISIVISTYYVKKLKKKGADPPLPSA